MASAPTREEKQVPETPETPDEVIFEDSEDIPSGRKARVIKSGLWNALADSAKRHVAKVAVLAPDAIEELRKDLSSAAVRAKYNVVTSTAALPDGRAKLTFHATAK